MCIRDSLSIGYWFELLVRWLEKATNWIVLLNDSSVLKFTTSVGRSFHTFITLILKKEMQMCRCSGKIEILSAGNLVCWKFAVIYQNSVWRLQFSASGAPSTFFPRRRWWLRPSFDVMQRITRNVGSARIDTNSVFLFWPSRQLFLLHMVPAGVLYLRQLHQKRTQ